MEQSRKKFHCHVWGWQVSGEEEIKSGQEQVIGTIDELYAYQGKIKLLREWMERMIRGRLSCQENKPGE